MPSLTQQPVGLTSPAHADDLRRELDSVLDSRFFLKAPLLTAFLRFVSEAALTDPDARLTEQEIGVQVFRREPGYDPGEDNIVRNYARQLRQRLTAYYTEDGQNDPIRIEIPKGGYAVRFLQNDAGAPPEKDETILLNVFGQHGSAAPAIHEDALEQPASPMVATPIRRRWSLAAIALLFVAILIGVSVRFVGSRRQAPLHPLWTQMFQSNRDTVIIPADIGFVILQQLNHRTYSLAEYESWPSVEQYDHVYTSFLKAQKYTSLLDLDAVSRIQRLPEVLPNRLRVRFARDLSMDDLSNDNVVLLGSNYSNPWVTAFEPSLNFRFANDPASGRSWIQNVHPVTDEAATYENTTRSISHETFGVIAFRPNFEKSGWVLIVEGLDGPGTQAAIDLLMEGNSLAHVIKEATLPDGRIGNFEVLLEANSLDARASDARLIAERYGH